MVLLLEIKTSYKKPKQINGVGLQGRREPCGVRALELVITMAGSTHQVPDAAGQVGKKRESAALVAAVREDGRL